MVRNRLWVTVALAGVVSGLGSPSAAQSQPAPGSMNAWLQCRAAAAHALDFMRDPATTAGRDATSVAQTQTMIARAVDLDRRFEGQISAHNMGLRSTAELNALQARFASQFSGEAGLPLAFRTLQACEAELNAP